MRLWYETPAREWTQALPLGNGHLGAMAYGGAEGRFDLSEVTCWSGAAQEKTLSDTAAESMKQARRLLTQERYQEAETLLADCCGLKENYGTQVPMGRLVAAVEREPVSTVRALDLMDGLCRDTLSFDDMTVVRESFCSNPDKVFCVRLQADAGSLPRLRVWLEGWSQPSRTEWSEAGFQVTGRALENIHSDGLHGVRYAMRLAVETDGASSWTRFGIAIDGATHLTLRMTAATSLFGEDPEALCAQRLEAVCAQSWDALRARHVEAHRGWMDRCTLSLAETNASGLPTDRRIAAWREDDGDQALIALFFQYGRYLLLNSSWPDSRLPAALQGVWNDDRACRMEWTDDMHLDINTQMNYYPAEKTGLSDCHTPLFRWIRERLMPEGERMAKALYGLDGWGAHTVSNAHGWAAPGWGVGWAFAVSGGAWVAYHLWEHYLYTRDKDFLQEHFDVLTGAARFLLGLLTEDPETGEWVTNPSYSPENAFQKEDGPHHVTTGCTFDILVTKTIFDAVLEGSGVIGWQDPLLDDIRAMLPKLPPLRVGRHGQLQEWHRDFDEAYPDHRHTSHLLGMHPFNRILPERMPELAAAVRTTLDRRLGDNATDIVLANWAGALLILYSARLREGSNALAFVRPMIRFLSRENMMITHEGPITTITGGIYELDGNTGFTAGVAEMLLQGHDGELDVLPAIPSDLRTGAFTGLVAYGGHVVDATWDEKTVRVTVRAGLDGPLTVRCGGQRRTVDCRRGESCELRFPREG